MVEVTFDCLRKYSKVIHIIGAALLLVLAFSKWASLSFSRMEFILAFYHVLLAFIIIVAEFPFKCFKCMLEYFGYMKYNFGKAGSCFFLFGLTVGSSILNIIVCVFFGLAGITFMIMGCTCKKAEQEKLKEGASTNSQPSNSAPSSNLPINLDLNAEASKQATRNFANQI